jgi:hypothetical protein
MGEMPRAVQQALRKPPTCTGSHLFSEVDPYYVLRIAGDCTATGIISVPVIRVGPPGYFIHVSITTPIVSALKNYYR